MSGTNMRIPSGVWGWTGTALVVLVVALPPLITLRLDPDPANLTEAAGVVGLVVNAVALAAALVLYFHWRLTTSNGTAWLTAALTAGAVKGLAMAGMRVAYPDQLAGARRRDHGHRPALRAHHPLDGDR